MMRALISLMLWLCVAILPAHVTAGTAPRCIMYLTGQHVVFPDEPEQLGEVTHVVLAFMSSSLFNDPHRSEWPFFTTVESVRSSVSPGTKVMIAIGGWADTSGFSEAALSSKSRRSFAKNVARMVTQTGADGVDIDWEYPGGNGEDYKRSPNQEKSWEILAYPLLLLELREALGSTKIISAAVPGLRRDMLAFTRLTVPQIMRHVDFLNVMSYDLVNRRDNVTKHHSDIAGSLEAVDAYIEHGAAPQQLNFGLGFYVKWLRTEHCWSGAASSSIGCPTLLLEDPQSGDDLGRSGAFSWHDAVPNELAASFHRSLDRGSYDDLRGAYYYWDKEEWLWWTYDTAGAIERKIPHVLDTRRLGGIFAWGLGEDAPRFEHLRAATKAVAARRQSRDEL